MNSADDRAQRLAMLLHSIEMLHNERAEHLSDWKRRLVVLDHEKQALKNEVLYGQKNLFSKGESETDGEKKAGMEVPPELGLAKSAE